MSSPTSQCVTQGVHSSTSFNPISFAQSSPLLVCIGEPNAREHRETGTLGVPPKFQFFWWWANQNGPLQSVWQVDGQGSRVKVTLLGHFGTHLSSISYWNIHAVLDIKLFNESPNETSMTGNTFSLNFDAIANYKSCRCIYLLRVAIKCPRAVLRWWASLSPCA